MENKLKKLRQEKGFTLKELAEKTGYAIPTINNFENGKYDASQEFLRKIGSALGVDPKEIIEAGSALELREESNGRIVRLETTGKRFAPVISWTSGGKLDSLASNYSDLETQIAERVETECKDPLAVALIVEGESMSPEIKPGDRVVIAPSEVPRNGDVVVARVRESGAVYLKRFRQTGPDGRNIILESVNPDYQPLKFLLTDFRFVYPAVEVKRFLRR